MCANVSTDGTAIVAVMNEQTGFVRMLKTWQAWCSEVSIVVHSNEHTEKRFGWKSLRVKVSKKTDLWAVLIARRSAKVCAASSMVTVARMTRTRKQQHSVFWGGHLGLSDYSGRVVLGFMDMKSMFSDLSWGPFGLENKARCTRSFCMVAEPNKCIR